MTRRARVLGALRGEAVDRVPVGVWRHHFVAENSAAGLAEETLRFARAFDWDYLKPQPRAQAFAEMWGLAYRPSVEPATEFTVTRTPFAAACDLERLEPADPRGGALGEQLLALRLIRARLGADVPIVWTIFAPIMVLPYLLRGGRAQTLDLCRREPKAVDHALAVIAETLAGYARACVEDGADGIFYATNVAREDGLTAAECRRFQRPHDLHVLGAAAGAPCTVLHLCGAAVHVGEFTDYPVAAFSWATGGGNPTLAGMHRRTGRAVVGGLPGKPEFAMLTTDELGARARRAVDEMQGRWLLLGPECSINPDTPPALLHAVAAAVRA
jgi:uroporphyrinogen decarboxylase